MGALVQARGKEEGSYHCPRIGGVPVWGEIDSCKQQITACNVSRD